MVLNKYWHKQLINREDNWVNRVRECHERRGNVVVRITGDGQIYSRQTTSNQDYQYHYVLKVIFLVRQDEVFYQEEQSRLHRACFLKNKRLIDHEEIYSESTLSSKKRSNPIIELTPIQETMRFAYDRRAAVKYAERWWNDANPAYRFFEENDCTNYISQCLHAGGAPMRGVPNRSTGWWYQNNDWSFSWSVAHAFRWYLSGSTKGLRGFEVDTPEKLKPGDVICYDFEGDGRFNHTTIVVAKDAHQQPLVNAHTNNSRQRYWDYQDSAAWTPSCQYKFFRIGSDML
ncbi:amidase domain-containing protein [Amphibacillus cookii]|uniref:amidase domain-containing protein n=1 Tax=Amphibacillus cookii TaxID=767787 RepID=UPI00195CA20B|nr:hypothetical protein [Amphibacillus cookii]